MIRAGNLYTFEADEKQVFCVGVKRFKIRIADVPDDNEEVSEDE